MVLMNPPFASEVSDQADTSNDVIPLKWRTMKTVFLLALASARRHSYLHVLSVTPGRYVFLRGNTQRQLMVFLSLEAGFLAKNQLPSQALQWIFMPCIAHLIPSEAERMLCPVRQLKLYLRDSEQIHWGWQWFTHKLIGSTTELQHMRSEPCQPHGFTTVRWRYLTFCQLRSGGRREFFRIPIYVTWPVSLMGCLPWVQWWSLKSWIQDISHLHSLHDLYAATDMVIERI